MKRALLVIILFSICGASFAQRNRIKFLSTFDNKALHFGFTLGLNYLDFSVRNFEYIGDNPNFYFQEWAGGPEVTPLTQVRADVAKLIPGFTVGIITSLRVSQDLELRFLPGMSFGERKLRYNIEVIDNYLNFNSKQYDYSIKSTFLDFPVHFKYKARRINNGRPYVIFGGAYRVDISKASEQDLVGLTRNGFYAELGGGWDTYLLFFRLSIEAKVSIGLNNQLGSRPVETQRQFYNDALRSLHSNIFTLSFHFE